jgi:deoxyhypusine monooxygenase
MVFAFPPISVLEECVADEAAPITKRMRAVYYLRTISTQECTDILVTALQNKQNSPLLRHELGYVLGQMQAKSALGKLSDVLRDVDDDAMVRHECAEALGAIGSGDSLALLREMCSTEQQEVAETCQMAAALIEWKLGGQQGVKPHVCACMDAGGKEAYNTHDPAPPSASDSVPTAALRTTLLDQQAPLFDR